MLRLAGPFLLILLGATSAERCSTLEVPTLQRQTSGEQVGSGLSDPSQATPTRPDRERTSPPPRGARTGAPASGDRAFYFGFTFLTGGRGETALF